MVSRVFVSSTINKCIKIWYNKAAKNYSRCNKVYIKRIVSTADATDEDIKNLYDLISKMLDNAKENHPQTVRYITGDIFGPVMRMAILGKSKKSQIKWVSKKKYSVRYLRCNHRVFDADCAGVERK